MTDLTKMKLVSAALAVLLVASTLLAGSRYFYCASMGESQFSSCCPEHASDDASETPELRSSSCCELRLIRGLPLAQIDARPLVAPAPLVAVVASLAPRATPAPAPPKPIRIRWGSDPPSRSDVRLQLMVFLT